LQLSRLSDAVDRVAKSDELRAIVAESDRDERIAKLDDFIARTHDYYTNPQNWPTRNGQLAPFESWIVMDLDGTLLVRAPASDVVGRNYAWRDYFQGVRRLAENPANDSVYISRVFQSESDQRYRCGLSAPIRAGDEPDAKLLGIVMATITTVSLPFEDVRHTAVLVGRWDTNRKPGQAADPAAPALDDLIVRHPKHQPGDPAVAIDSPIIDALRQARADGRTLGPRELIDDYYTDPLGRQSDEYAGRWLAGFAPVGNTEFVVVVQRRYDEAVGPVNRLATTLAWRGWTALSFGVILLGAMWYYVQRAMHREERIEPAAARPASPADNGAGTEVMPLPPQK
jgi:serine/threonine-protein kinase